MISGQLRYLWGQISIHLDLISPFLSDNDDTLYFASNGFGGYGDADIFYALRNGEGWDSWSAPVNLGEVINSPNSMPILPFLITSFIGQAIEMLK